jgi:general secretion pathway protein I
MRPKQNRGFTLIEVLVAFTILALVLAVVMRSLSSGLSHEHTAGLTTARVLEARSILDRVGADYPLEAGTIEGELATGEPWVLTVRLVETEADASEQPNALNIYLAELQIEGADGRALSLKKLSLGQ